MSRTRQEQPKIIRVKPMQCKERSSSTPRAVISMNIYGKALTDAKRLIHRKVVEMVLKSKREETAGHTRRRLRLWGVNWRSEIRATY
jgi:hypothetical protein